MQIDNILIKAAMDKKTLLLSVGVGVGVAAVGGVLYAWLREDEFGIGGRRGGSEHATSRPVVIEMKIPESCAGIVIGRQGENIKEIQRKTNTKINFRDELATDTERVIVIRGQPDEAQLAEILIHQTIANQPRMESVELKVPDKVTGRLIGKKGESIRRMQNMSRCRIDIDKGVDEAGLKKITLKGTTDQIAFAKRLIEEKLDEEEEMQRRIRDSVQNRPPRLKYRDPLFLTSENGGGFDDSGSSSSSTVSASGGGGRYERFHASAGESSCGVFVSAVCDPSKFFVQKVGVRSVDLDKLVQEMTNFYESRVNRQLHSLNEVSEGDLVVAQWPGDRKWYRAKVVEVVRDEYDEGKVELEVDFVDYGDAERKNKADVCDMRTDFLKLSFQAIECSLANVKPRGEKWTNQAIDDFANLTKCAQWKELQAEIVEYKTSESGLVPLVELIDTSSTKAVNISLELVKLGHAVATQPTANANDNGTDLKKANNVAKAMPR